MTIQRHPSIPATHPGELLREDVLPSMTISKTEFASAIGISRQALHNILTEKQPVTANMAIRLGHFFGTSAESWLNMQINYDLQRARQRLDLSAHPTIADMSTA
jgi:addiction module HigA family antidote